MDKEWFLQLFSIQVADPVNSPITPEISSPKSVEVGCNTQKNRRKSIFCLNAEPEIDEWGCTYAIISQPTWVSVLEPHASNFLWKDKTLMCYDLGYMALLKSLTTVFISYHRQRNHVTQQNYPLLKTWRVNNISRLKSLRDLSLQVCFVVFYFLVPLNNVLYVCTYCICIYKLYKRKGMSSLVLCWESESTY